MTYNRYYQYYTIRNNQCLIIIIFKLLTGTCDKILVANASFISSVILDFMTEYLFCFLLLLRNLKHHLKLIYNL